MVIQLYIEGVIKENIKLISKGFFNLYMASFPLLKEVTLPALISSSASFRAFII